MILQIVLFVIDVLLLNIAFLLSFLLRYGVNIPALNFQPYKDNFPFLTFVYMSAFMYTRVFKRRFSSYWDLFKRLFGGLFLGTLFGVALVYVFRIKWSSFPSSINAGNDLKQILEESQAGLVCLNGEDEQFCNYAKLLAKDLNLRHQMGQNARKLLEKTFSVTRATSQILSHME